MKTPKIHIEASYDGWTIIVDKKIFHFDHQDEDLGASVVKAALEHLGFSVELKEIC